MPYLAGRHAGRHRAEPARRSEPHERRSDPRDRTSAGARACSAAQIQEMLDEQVRDAQTSSEHILKIFDGDEDVAKLLSTSSTTTSVKPARAEAARSGVFYGIAGLRRRARERTSRTRSTLAGLPDQRPGDALRRPHAARRSIRR